MENAYNRLGIFVFYDKDGVVDDYVLHILNELSTVTKRLVIVCNGTVKTSDILLLKQYSNEIFIRKNIGYDATAYKESLMQYLEWDQILKYDELLLSNDTYFGPFVPLTRIFERMEKRDCDFWGLTSHEERRDINIPYHIQSYFVVIRKRLLHSVVFFNFWRTLAKIRTHNEGVQSFELRLTSYFQKNGFVGKALSDTLRLESVDKMSDYSYLYLNSYRMMAEFETPIIKRKCFSIPTADLFRYSYREDTKRSIDYIQNHTDYDVGMIWKHLIRQFNPKQLADSLGLTFILPNTCSPTIDISYKKIAILAHIYYNDAAKVETCFSYLGNVPATIDIYITSSLSETKELIQAAAERYGITNYHIVMIGNRGREIRGMLVECADIFYQYEYVCFVHDKKTSGGGTRSEPEDSFMYLLWDNLLRSEDYIRNILHTFEQNPYLGLLVPPPPYHWRYIGNLRNLWCINFNETKRLVNRLGLNCVISPEYAPLTLGTAYWCRTAALRPLVDHGLKPEDFPEEPLKKQDGTFGHAIERIFSFVAQHTGYATGIVMNEEYAALHMSNYQECIRTLEKSIVSDGENYLLYPLILYPKSIRALYRKFRDVYIYGAGELAGEVIKKLLRMGLEPKGCIVSDGHRRTDNFCGYPVWELSELELDQENTGIILALNKDNQRQVLHSLLARQFTNIYLGG